MSERSASRHDAVLGVIPARLGSHRLPRKPLHVLAGRPLIEWVWRRVSTLDALDAAVIATDSDEVARVCRGFGAAVELTSPDHASGTERVAEVAARSAFRDYGVIVNVQGDEPFVTAAHVGGAVGMVAAGWDVGTVAAPVGSSHAFADPAVVKVVRNGHGRALYFSRAPIPHSRDRAPTPDELASDAYLRHIGVYAFTHDALRRWTQLPPSQLERTERLEQLRPLGAGLGIGVAVVDGAEGGIDTPEDARRAEDRLRRHANDDTNGDSDA